VVPVARQHADQLISAELGRYHAARAEGDVQTAWTALERVHVVAQPFPIPHLASHWQMLVFSIALRDWRETAGQLLRLVLVPVGSLTGRLPVGNTGRARISAFRSMPIAPDLEALISRRDKPAAP
jgi:hypothetical protein